MRRAALIPALVAVLLLLGVVGVAAKDGRLADVAAASRREAKALNWRLHRWLVQSGAMRCDACGPPRKLDVWKLLRGW